MADFNGERANLLLNYLRELRALEDSGVNCVREINGVMTEISGELGVGKHE